MKHPNFNLEQFFIDQDVAWKTHSGGDHTEYAVNCPKCHERGEPTPDTKQKLWINSEKGTFHCYRCQWTGTMTRLVQGFTGFTYLNAIKLVRGSLTEGMDFLNLTLHTDRFEKFEEQNELREVELPHGYEPIEGPHPYLAKRGIPWQYAQKHDWGVSVAGYTKDRIIVPTFMNSKLVFWQARATWEPSDVETEDDNDIMLKKVLNPKGASARHVLYNFDVAKNYETIVIVEGFIDAVKTGPNAVATNGKNLHPAQVEYLRRTKAKKIIMFWDADSWTDGKTHKGKRKPSSMQKAVELLRSANFEVLAAKLPPSRDPGSFKYRSLQLQRILSRAKEPKF
jgi:hypothetical protein